MKKPKPPASLNAHGSILWRQVVKVYDLRTDELTVLASACKAADRIALVETAWVGLGMPMMSKGSMGQEVTHPLFAEMQKLEAHQAALLARLKLPDEPTGVTANQNRDAANSSWQPGVRGRGA